MVPCVGSGNLQTASASSLRSHEIGEVWVFARHKAGGQNPCSRARRPTSEHFEGFSDRLGAAIDTVVMVTIHDTFQAGSYLVRKLVDNIPQPPTYALAPIPRPPAQLAH